MIFDGWKNAVRIDWFSLFVDEVIDRSGELLFDKFRDRGVNIDFNIQWNIDW